MFHDDYWVWFFFFLGLIVVVLYTGLSNTLAVAERALGIADCSW